MTPRPAGWLAVLAILVLGLLLAAPRPARSDDDPVAAAADRVRRLVVEGRNLDALQATVATFDALPAELHEAWFFVAARTCILIGSTRCAHAVLHQPSVLAFRPDRLYPQTAGSVILLLAWMTARQGDDGEAQKILDNGIPPSLATPLSNPVLYAELALLAAHRARRISNFGLSRRYLDGALAAVLSLQAEADDARSLVLRIIRQHLANYDAERALRLFVAAARLPR